MAFFVIEGSAIMAQIRGYLAEGSFRNAYQMLTDSFELSEGTMIDILKGKLTITGNSRDGMGLDACQEEEVVKELIDSVAFNYFTCQGRTYQIACKLSSLHLPALNGGIGSRNLDLEELEDGLSPRALALAKDLVSRHQLGFSDESIASDTSTRILIAKLAELFDKPELSRMEVELLPDPQGGYALCFYEESSFDAPYWYKLSESPSEEAILYAVSLDVPSAAAVSINGLKARTERIPSAWLTRLCDVQRGAHEVEQEMAQIAEKVRTYADNDTVFGWERVPYIEEGKLKELNIPRHAFLLYQYGLMYSQRRAASAEPMSDIMQKALDLNYIPFSPQNLKMINDSQYHSDAWLGAGLPLDDAYDSKTIGAQVFYAHAYGTLLRTDNKSFDTLTRGKAEYFEGSIASPEQAALMTKEALKDTILCARFASSDIVDLALRCKGVVVEQGGKLAHMVLVSREAEIPVVRVSDATEVFIPGMRVRFYMEAQKWEYL